MPRLIFYAGDKVKLINGRHATIIERSKTNNYYYKVETYNDKGIKRTLEIFVLDMRLRERFIESQKEVK
jgi:hypothetical protein